MPYTEDELTQANQDLEQALDTLDPDTTEAQDTTDLRLIAEAASAVAAAEALLRERVEIARARGRSWNRIAIPLGVSRQAARQRFAGDSPPASARGEDLVAALEGALDELRRDADSSVSARVRHG